VTEDETRAVLRRIERVSVGAYFCFAAIIIFTAGWRAVVGLTCSAAVTMISFLWMEEVIGSLFQPTSHLRAKLLTLRTVARFGVLGVALWVTIVVARFHTVSVLLGFSIVVVGIIGEALYSTVKSF
jgi:hypothetical protein